MAWESLQFLIAVWGELEVGPQSGLCGGDGCEYLAWFGFGHDTGGDVHGQPSNIVAPVLEITDVNSRADPQVTALERFADGDGCV